MDHDPALSGGDDSEPEWEYETPDEEKERVDRHVGMIESILALKPADLDSKGVEQTVITELFFDRYVREGDLIAIGPFSYTGTLKGLEFGPKGPVIVFEHLRTELLADMPDDGWEYEQRILVCVEDEARVPVRDIDVIAGTSATPGAWEQIAKRSWQDDDED